MYEGETEQKKVSNTRRALDALEPERPLVLIVEDDPDLGAFLCCWLEGHGLKAVAVEGGIEALSLLDKFRPDLMVTDLAMPRFSGLELIHEVKQRAELAELPIVAITAYRGNYLQDALSAGANVVLRKPEDFDLLPETIYDLLWPGHQPQQPNEASPQEPYLTFENRAHS